MGLIGVVKEQTIEYDQPIGSMEGQRIEIEVNPIETIDMERYGFKVIPPGGNLVTNEMVDELRDELGI